MSIISGFYKVKNYVKTTEGYKILSRLTSSDSVDVNGKTLTEVVNELGTAAKKDVAASGNASITQVVMGNDTRLTDARKASDVSAWAKASTKPTYTASEVDAYTKTETDTKLNGKANSSHTHGNGDITSLDAGKITSGTISIDRLPQGALERLTIVVDDTARFKLTSATIQKGDTVKVTSTGKMYYVVDETKLSSESGYEVYAAGTAASVPWSGVTGKPSTYTPSSHTHDDRYYTESEIDSKLSGKANSSHTHTIANITNLQSTLDGKAASNHTHSQYLTSHQDISGKMDKDPQDITYYKNYDAVSGDNTMVYVPDAVDIKTYADAINTIASVLDGTKKYTDDLLMARKKVSLARTADKAANDSNGNKIVDTYATKNDLNGKLGASGDGSTVTSGFTSNDTVDADAAAWTSVPKLTTGSTLFSLFTNISTMFKNVRFLKKKMDSLLDTVYPVGSIYMSVNDASPATFIGGTWVPWGMGRTIVGVGANEANTNTNRGNASANEFNISNPEVKGGEYIHTLSVNEMPSHDHNVGGPVNHSWGVNFGNMEPTSGRSYNFAFTPDVVNGNKTYAGDGARAWNNGGGQAHNNVQPYITCYMWKRTK